MHQRRSISKTLAVKKFRMLKIYIYKNSNTAGLYFTERWLNILFIKNIKMMILPFSEDISEFIIVENV